MQLHQILHRMHRLRPVSYTHLDVYKRQIVDLALSTEDDILILDPESEFGSLVEALNGEVISISATSHTHLNACLLYTSVRDSMYLG